MGLFTTRHAAPEKGAALTKLRTDLDSVLLHARQHGLSSLVIAEILEQRVDAERQRHAVTAPSSYVSARVTTIGASKDEPRKPSGYTPMLSKIAAAIGGR